MAVNLRPLSLGEIFDRMAELYRKNFALFAGLYAVYAGVIMVLGLLQIWASSIMRGGPAGVARAGAFGIFSLVEMCVMFALIGVSMAANNRAVAWVILGEPATISAAYQSILPKAGRYVWLMIVTGFRIFLWMVPVGIVVGIVAVLAAMAGRSAGGAGFGILGGIFAFICIAVGVIWVMLRYSLAVPACVVEDLEAGEAIKRSVELTKGSRGRIFVLLLLTMVITLAIVAVTQFPFLFAAFKHPRQPLAIGIQVLQQVLNFITNTLIGPIYMIGVTLFYYDQRIRKEGFDIEWMIKAAGLTSFQSGDEGSSLSGASESEAAQF